ncbi:hypothetical protein GCM10020229_16900 [Kitasatospora albolonga]|uniref:hypothetical protein n=1 Tax=Kitasatospora albolonga TaxID=68173 RepID=UPI0031E56790
MRISRLLAAALLTALAVGVTVQLGVADGRAGSPAELGYININNSVLPSPKPV